MIDARLTAQVDLETEKSRKKVIELQNEIRKLEEAIIATREQKLTDGKDAKSIAEFNKELQKSSIELKKKRLALRDANAELKQKIAANREATKAQQQFTQAVTTSKDGVEAINSVLAKYPSSTQATSQSLEALKNRLIELRRLRFNEILNPADQKLLARQIFETTNEIRDQKTALAQLAREANATEQANKRLSASQQQFRNQAGASNAVALEFNRIIQDAPFGIIGVGNNIQQLAGNFSALRASAGGTSAAISAALGSIINPANLVLLGISAVTSAWTAYQLGVFDSKEETKELVNETDRFNEALNNLLNRLNAVNSARLEGNKSAQDELVELELLTNTLNDSNRSQFERLRAFKILQDQYPRILGNMSDEEALAKGIGKAYKTINLALIEKAQSIAVQEKLIELYKNEFDLLQKQQSETTLQNQLFQERLKIVSELEKQGVKVNQNGRTYAEIIGDQTISVSLFDTLDALISINNQFELLSSISSATEDNLSNNGTQVDLLKSKFFELNQSLIALLDPLKKPSELAGGFKLTRDEVGKLITDLENFKEKYNNIRRDLMDQNFSAEMRVETGESELRRNINLGQLPIPSIEGLRAQIQEFIRLRDELKITDTTGIEKYNVQISLLQEKLKQLTGDAEIVKQTNDLTRSLSDAFSAMAQQISASLNISNDSLKAFVGTLLSQTPKIIGAIARTVAANRAATAEGTKLSLKQALANGIVTGTEGAKALGPIGLALLPVFVGGAMALISGAFKKAGINAPGGGAGSAIRSAGANAVGSSITGAGQSFDLFGDLQLSTFIRGTNIELVLERVNQQRRA